MALSTGIIKWLLKFVNRCDEPIYNEDEEEEKEEEEEKFTLANFCKNIKEETPSKVSTKTLTYYSLLQILKLLIL